MAAVRFYFDEHISNAIAEALRSRGVEVITTAERDMMGRDDTDQLTSAHSLGLVVVTHDPDYLRLHESGQQHSGIAFARMGTPIRRMVNELLLIWGAMEAHEMVNHVEFIS